MKRYKLLKDLPTFKAGDLFYISEYGALVHNGGDPDGYNVMAYAQSTLEKFPNILTEWFEEIPNPTDSIHWKPKIGQRYFYIDDGYVFSDVWIDSRVDNRRYMAGAIYYAETDAKKALKRQIAITTLMRDSNFEPDWSNNDQNKWTVYYNHNDKELLVEATAFLQYPSAIYFDTYDSIKKSIKNHKKEWLIYLGVEDD
nr:MAG TPA: hypothetical protein [Caudoviricetes sp.]